MIPNDTLTPGKTSGLRIGFAAVTTRGCTEPQAREIARIINSYLNKSLDKESAIQLVKKLTDSWRKIENI